MNSQKETQRSVKALAEALLLNEDAVWKLVHTSLTNALSRKTDTQLEEPRVLNHDLAILEKQLEQNLANAHEAHKRRSAELSKLEARGRSELIDIQEREDELKRKIADVAELIKARHTEVEKLKSQLAEIRKNFSVVDHEKKQHEFDIMMSKHAQLEATDPAQRLLKVVLLIFTLVGVALAIYFVKTRGVPK